METKRFVTFTGLWSNNESVKRFPKKKPHDFVACADSGYFLCKAAGIKPDIVIGDFDSLSKDIVSEIESLGIECIMHPGEKDDTDTMLCVKYGIALGYDDFVIIGGIGGDFGHTMANVQVLSFLTDMECGAVIVTEREKLFMADGLVSFSGRPGAKFSVFSFTETCTGVFVTNAKYELEDDVLTLSSPVGVRNEFINEDPVTVSLLSGRLLVIVERKKQIFKKK